MPSDRNGSHTDLYRYFDSNDRLLYVGISFNAFARASQHRADKPWWNDVARMERQAFPTREQAAAAELEAIRTEKPIHNVIGSTKRKHREFDRSAPWACQMCGWWFGNKPNEGYIQLDQHDSWWVQCSDCDDLGTAARYWIDANRLATIEDVQWWSDHVGRKQWFIFSSWVDMFDHCNIKKARIEASRNALNERRGGRCTLP